VFLIRLKKIFGNKVRGFRCFRLSGRLHEFVAM